MMEIIKPSSGYSPEAKRYDNSNSPPKEFYSTNVKRPSSRAQVTVITRPSITSSSSSSSSSSSPSSPVSPSSPPRSASLSTRSTSISTQPGSPVLKRTPTSRHSSWSRSSGETTPRRLGRKLPPELTESLLALEEQQKESKSDMISLDSKSSTVTVRLGNGDQNHGISKKSSPNPSLDTAYSADGHHFTKYTLNVDPPMDQLMAWAGGLSPSATAPLILAPELCLPPPRPSRSIHRAHRRQSSLTPSDSPSSAPSTSTSSTIDPPTPTSSSLAVSKFRNNWPSRRNLSPAPATSPITLGAPVPVPVASGSKDLPPIPTPQLHSHSHSPTTPHTQQVPSLTTCSTASTSCWSAFEDFEHAHPQGPRGKESRKQKKERKRQEAQEFSADEPPELRDLFSAGMCEVIDEHGTRVAFRELVSEKKTIVIFIRHWYCPLCAQYMNSIIANVTPRVLEDADMDLIVIGNGSYKMLDGYRNKHFKFPFKMYTDPSLALYRALGLTRQTGDAGADIDAGSYLIQTPLEATVETIKRATKMPLRLPGHFLQLGGEFVFDGALNVIYTHRMTTTRDHSPIESVCGAAGLELAFVHYEPGPRPPPVHRASMDGDLDGDWAWKAEREETLANIKMKKQRRRGMIIDMDIQEGSESEEGEYYVSGGSGREVADPELRELAKRIERSGRL